MNASTQVPTPSATVKRPTLPVRSSPQTPITRPNLARNQIVISGISKPRRRITMKELKSTLGIDQIDDPNEEWNTLRDAARKIYSKKGFKAAESVSYQG